MFQEHIYWSLHVFMCSRNRLIEICSFSLLIAIDKIGEIRRFITSKRKNYKFPFWDVFIDFPKIMLSSIFCIGQSSTKVHSKFCRQLLPYPTILRFISNLMNLVTCTICGSASREFCDVCRHGLYFSKPLVAVRCLSPKFDIIDCYLFVKFWNFPTN